MNKKTAIQYLVYRDLNDPHNVFIARTDEVVAGIFQKAAGPFASRKDAEQAKSELEAGGSSHPQ